MGKFIDNFMWYVMAGSFVVTVGMSLVQGARP